MILMVEGRRRCPEGPGQSSQLSLREDLVILWAFVGEQAHAARVAGRPRRRSTSPFQASAVPGLKLFDLKQGRSDAAKRTCW